MTIWDAYVLEDIPPEDFKFVPVWLKELRDLKEQDEFLYDCLYQSYEPSIGAAIAAARLYEGWIEGRIEFAVVEIGEKPPADIFLWRPKLPEPFEMKFWGYRVDYDGYLKWNAPIQFTNPKSKQSHYRNPKCVPIEIGKCHPARILLVLNVVGYIARLPDGHSKILILARTKDWLEPFDE